MIRFDLLCDLKEVESMNITHNHPTSSIRTPKRQVSHSDSLSLGPTAIMDLLGHSRSHAIAKGVTINPKLHSQACLLVNMDQNYQLCSSDLGI